MLLFYESRTNTTSSLKTETAKSCAKNDFVVIVQGHPVGQSGKLVLESAEGCRQASRMLYFLVCELRVELLFSVFVYAVHFGYVVIVVQDITVSARPVRHGLITERIADGGFSIGSEFVAIVFNLVVRSG